MSESESGPDLISDLAHEFAERYRHGERPALDEYTQRYPDLATQIRELFPALVVMEQFGSVAGEPTPQATERPVPKQLGEYRILREIGRGGMGIVYEAVQESLGRHVALKVLPMHQLLAQTLRERFEREAKAAARLHHTNIVPVFGIGVHEGIHFYAMQYIQGQALDTVLQEVRHLRGGEVGAPRQHLTASIAEGLLTGVATEAPTASAKTDVTNSVSSAASSGQSDLTGSSYTRYFAGVARVGIQVADALAYAHSMGMVHRDIKPSNLLLDTQATTWITDFGLVKDEGGSDLTTPGDIVGTIRYMAPERLDNQGDGRSDIYGLGATLYEMLTLRPAFPGERRLELMDQVRHVEPRRPRQIDAHIPRDLETVVLKAMAKEPARRYQTAGEMAEDLRRFLADRPVLARRSTTLERSWRWCRRNPVVAALTAVVVVLLSVLLVGSRISNARLHKQLDRAEKAEGDAQRESLSAKESAQTAERRLRGSYLAQARAGRFSRQAGQRFTGLDVLAKAAAIEPGMDLRNEAIACMALPDLRAIEPNETPPSLEIIGAWGLEVSFERDGTIVLTRKSDNEELARLPSSAGPVTEIRNSPDGNWLAAYHNVAGHFAWVVWDWRRRQAVLQKPYAPGTPSGWSSDCTCFYYGGTDGLFHMHDLIHNVELHAVSLQKAPWIAKPDLYALSPDRRLLAIIGKTGSANSQAIVQVYDLKTGAPIAELVHPEAPPHSSAVWRVAWDPDSRLLAAARHDGLYIWDVRQKKQQAYMKSVRGDIAMVFSRVGNLLLSSGSTTLTQVSDPLTGTPLVSIRGEFASTGLIAERWLPRYWPAPGFLELADGEECRTFHTAGRDFGPHAAFHPRLPLLALADQKGVHLCDLSTMREAAFLDLATCTTVLFHHQGDLLTYTPKYGLLRWPVREAADEAATIIVGPPRQLYQAPITQVISASHCWAALGPGEQVAVADWGRRQAVLLNMDWPEEKTVFGPHEGARCVSVSPNGEWIATGVWLGKGIKVWDVKTAQLIQEFPAEWAAHAFFSPDGKWLIGCLDQEYRFWKVGSWELERMLSRKEPTYPGIVAFSPDGQLMALCDSLAEVKLVECASGREIAQLPSHVGQDIVGLCFSPDGARLAVTLGGDGGALLWDLRAVRRQLAALDLDWELPPYPPPMAPEHREPIRVRVVDTPMPPAVPVMPEMPQNVVLANRLALFELLAAQTPYHPEPFHQRGHIREALGQHREATADFTRALVWVPGAAHLYYDRGRNREAVKDHALAARDFEKAVALAPNYVYALNALARLYVTGPPELRAAAKAVPLARRATQLAPGNWSYLNTLGVALFRAGEFREAAEILEKNSKDPKNPTPGYDLLFLTMAQHRQGDFKNAQICFDRAVAWRKEARLTMRQLEEWEKFQAEADALFAADSKK